MSAAQMAHPSIDSLYDEAIREAERHKWIESQKQGRDLGETAIRDWYRVHWMSYCRHRRLEHVRGSRCWREFEDEQFGRLYSSIVAGDLLADRILDRVYNGYENLDVLLWALEWGLPIDRVIDLLSQIDVNRARLDPRA
ncbi:MAG: hypothetical protein WD066_00875 [Planctomycetaceae bacterium]